MGVTKYQKYEFVPIRSSQTCPICGRRTGRCSAFVESATGNVLYYKCKYQPSNDETSDGYYKHYTNNTSTSCVSNVPKVLKLENYKQTTITDEDLILWDKVYRKLRAVIKKITGDYLYKEHKENLLQRGFTEAEITNMGFFSIPKSNKVPYENYTCKLPTAIIKELQKTFKPEELLRVPGFSKGSYKGNDFVTFKNTMKNKENNQFEDIDGYFIPYHNSKGLLVGMQYRLTKEIYDDKGKKLRYLWYSSKEVTCGSPIDYYIPMKVDLDNIILITEGAIKAKFAATKLNVRSLGEAGVGNYRNLITNLQAIEKLENKKYKVLLALDMDKYENLDVIKAEIKTVTLLKSLGYSVTILEWNESEGKGIDDKLSYSGKKGLRYLNV